MGSLRYIIFVVLLMICTSIKAETPTIHSRLPLQQDGPLTASPWFTSAQPTASASKNHYIYSTPPLLYYYGIYGYGNYGFGWYAPYFSYPRSAPIIYNYSYIRR